MTEGRPAATWKRRLLLGASALAIGIVCLEVVARVRLLVRYGRASGDLYDTVIDEASGLAVPAPNQRIGSCRINSLGFRGPDLEVAKPKDAVRIAFLGASTTFCAEVNDDAETWPALVAARLAARFPGVRFEAVNAGLPGTGVDEAIRNLEGRVARLAPDVVVLYEATNDLSRDTRKLAIERGLIDGPPDDRGFLARHSALYDLVQKNLRIALRRRAVESAESANGAAGGGLLEFDAEALARAHEPRIERFVAAARKAGASLVVLPTFTTQLREGQSRARRVEAAVTSTYYMPYLDPDRVLRGFLAYNGAIRRAAAKSGALLVETAEAVPADGGHFHDSVHFTARGCEKMAEAVAVALENDATLAALVERRRASH